MARPRVPASFLILPAGFCGMFAIIWGGVAVSQGPNADWTVCLWFLGGLAVCAVVRLVAPVEWISEDELERMAKAERAEAIEKEVEAIVSGAQDGTIAEKYRFSRLKHYGFVALVIALTFHEYLIGDAKMADGAKGMGIAGLTLGSWRLFGKTWTGFELLFMGGCLAYLYVTLRAGVSRLARAQKKP